MVESREQCHASSDAQHLFPHSRLLSYPYLYNHCDVVSMLCFGELLSGSVAASILLKRTLSAQPEALVGLEIPDLSSDSEHDETIAAV